MIPAAEYMLHSQDGVAGQGRFQSFLRDLSFRGVDRPLRSSRNEHAFSNLAGGVGDPSEVKVGTQNVTEDIAAQGQRPDGRARDFPSKNGPTDGGLRLPYGSTGGARFAAGTQAQIGLQIPGPIVPVGKPRQFQKRESHLNGGGSDLSRSLLRQVPSGIRRAFGMRVGPGRQREQQQEAGRQQGGRPESDGFQPPASPGGDKRTVPRSRRSSR